MHPACEFNDITTYLLAPVQRLPRYLLLVKKMIHYTQKIETAVSPVATAAVSTKRHRPKVGLRNAAAAFCQQQSTVNLLTVPGFPSFKILKKAESALHAMLLELDEMVGSEMVDLKSGARSLKVTPSYSNNCSDSVDGNSTDPKSLRNICTEKVSEVSNEKTKYVQCEYKVICASQNTYNRLLLNHVNLVGVITIYTALNDF